MNKKNLKKIVTLFKDGVSEELCVALLIDLMPHNSSSLEIGKAIHSFYSTIYIELYLPSSDKVNI